MYLYTRKKYNWNLDSAWQTHIADLTTYGKFRLVQIFLIQHLLCWTCSWFIPAQGYTYVETMCTVAHPSDPLERITSLEVAMGFGRLMATSSVLWIHLQIVGHTCCKVSKDLGVDAILSGMNVLLEALQRVWCQNLEHDLKALKANLVLWLQDIVMNHHACSIKERLSDPVQIHQWQCRRHWWDKNREAMGLKKVGTL